MNLNDTSGRLRLTLVLLAFGLGIAAFLPWVTVTAPFVGTIERNGINGASDGWFALAGALVLAFSAWKAPKLAFLPAIGLLVLGIYEAAHISSRLDDMKAKLADNPFASSVDGSVGIGVWLLLVGSVFAVAISVWLLYDMLHPKVAPRTATPVAEPVEEH